MKNLLNKNIKTVIMFACIVLGMIMICFSGEHSKNDTEKDDAYMSNLSSYADLLEEKFASTIERIDGAGKATVMITLEGSFEKVYASNARVEESNKYGTELNDKTSEKQLVLAGSASSGEAPVLLKELCPKVKGVAVICSGAGDKNIERMIKDAAVSLFGVPEMRVYVAKGGE